MLLLHCLLLLSCREAKENPDESIVPPSLENTDILTETATDSSAEPTSEPDADTACELIHGEGEPLAMINECNGLTYGMYAAQNDDVAHNRLPDFSHAGYMHGGVLLPDVPIVITLDPEPGDNHARIQSAIDSISAMNLDGDGHRGALLLRAGHYELSAGLNISSGGVVLRGEGQGEDGTVLYDVLNTQHSSIVVSGSGNGIGEIEGSREIITADIPVGTSEVSVNDGSRFLPGDSIGVQRTPNQRWIDDLDMAQYGWTPSSYTITHERKITAIEGNILTVDIPIVDSMYVSLGGGAVFVADVPGRIEQVGIENLRLV